MTAETEQGAAAQPLPLLLPLHPVPPPGLHRLPRPASSHPLKTKHMFYICSFQINSYRMDGATRSWSYM